MIWNLIGTIGGKVLDIVDDVVEDKDEANKLKFQIQRQLIETKSSELEAQAKTLEADLRRALDANPRDKHGGHDYSREDLGEDPVTLRRRFDRYQRAFSVPDDG